MPDISVKLIDPPPILLRQVDRQSVEYIELRDSIDELGVLASIVVRPRGDRFQVVEGMYRLSCAIDLRLETIPATVKDVTDDELLWIQVQANACRRVTKPVEYAAHLKRLMRRDPTLTIGEVSARLHKSSTWIREQLQLLWLPKDVQKLIDRGEITLGNAYLLHKVPNRRDYIEQAKTMPTKEFKRLIAGVVKQYTEQQRQGKLDAHFTNHFEPQPHLRNLSELTAEMESRCEGPRVLTREDSQTHIDGFYAALLWVMHMDKDSIEQQERNFFKNFRTKESDE